MKIYNERLPLIDEAIDKLNLGWFAVDDDCLYKSSAVSYRFTFGSKDYMGGNHVGEFVCTRQEFEQRVKERESMKNKNDWYIKGDLPPEGSIVIINIDYKLTNGFKTLDVKAGEKVRVVQHVDYGYGKVCLISVRNNSFGATTIFSNLRPLPTEEDEMIEQAENCLRNANTQVFDRYTYKTLSKQLIKDGWRPPKQD